MAAVDRLPARSKALPPAVTARWVLLGVVALNLVIVELIWATGGPGKNGLLTVAKFFGMNLAFALMVQLTLIARIPWLDRRIGMDRLTVWHRLLGLSIFWLVVLHASFILLGYARHDRASVWHTFKGLAGVTASLFGMLAAGTVLLVIFFSLRYVRRRVSYETWHAVHLLLYAAVVVALLHQMFEGTSFKSSPFAAGYWWAAWSAVLLALLVGRVAVPLWRNAYHRFRVEKVVPESDNVVSVYVTGRHLDRLPARAGQFFIWRFLGHNTWWQANPFSMSAAPDGRVLRLTAKAVGTTSAGLRGVPVGCRAFLEGPYGAFTAMHRIRDRMLLVAGGVGITPIRALLEETDGPAVVLYRVHRLDDAVLLGELRELAAARGADVHVLTGRTGVGTPPNTPFAPENLRALVPDVAERDVYVCGPAAMTAAVLRSLREVGVPDRQVHAEKFSLA